MDIKKLKVEELTKLADETSIGKSTIASYESRGVTPKPDKAQKLAEYFNVSVAYLLGYIDTPKEELMTFDTGEEFEKARQNLLDEYSITCYYLGKKEEGKKVTGIRYSLV